MHGPHVERRVPDAAAPGALHEKARILRVRWPPTPTGPLVPLTPSVSLDTLTPLVPSVPLVATRALPAGTYLSQYEFLFVDVGIIIPLSLLLPHTRPSPTLSWQRPLSSMLHWSFVASIVGQARAFRAFRCVLRSAAACFVLYRPRSPPGLLGWSFP